MPVHAHKYNTRLQASFRNKVHDLIDAVDEMRDYDSEEPDPIEMLNLLIDYYTFLQFFQCWRNDEIQENYSDILRNEISIYKNWYRFENGVPIHQYWNCRDKKEAVQLWYTMDALEKLLKK
jgi:hypothetical protein